MRLIRTSRLMLRQRQVMGSDQQVPVLMFFEYERKRPFNRVFDGSQRITAGVRHALLNSRDGVRQVPSQALGSGSQPVGLGLGQGAMQRGAQRREKCGYEG